MDLEFEMVPGSVCALAESPVWDAARGALLWCDILSGRIFEWEVGSGKRREWGLPGKVGSFGLAAGERLVVACGQEILILDRATGAVERLTKVEEPVGRTRLNDGKVGPDAAFWVGSMDDTPAKEAVGALYRVTVDGRVEKKVGGLITSNGLAWGPGQRVMYHSDSRARQLWAWDFDVATGEMSRRRLVAELDDAAGRPDGGACDEDGVYWSAGVTAGVLNRFDAAGRMLGKAAVPVPGPTMPCFGGEDGKTLFVTSLRGVEGVAGAGGVFWAKVEVAGVQVGRFG